MREIKFRAWQDGQMLVQPLAGVYGAKRLFGLLYEDTNLMQFTGLLDKNGKEIYEGDIVESFCNINKISDPHLTDIEPEFNHKAVKFKDGAFILYSNEYDFTGVLGYTGATKSETLNIIGNIYENPELMTDK